LPGKARWVDAPKPPRLLTTLTEAGRARFAEELNTWRRLSHAIELGPANTTAGGWATRPNIPADVRTPESIAYETETLVRARNSGC
jgi:hypothetical protein